MILRSILTFINSLKYQQRFLLALCLALSVCVLVLKLWPRSEPRPAEVYVHFEQEEIYVEDVITTRQSSAPAAPPKPIPPVPVPNDEIIEEQIHFPEFDDIFVVNPLQEPDEGFGRAGEEGRIVGSPDRPPALLRIVEPTVPEAAKKANIKAQIIVSFLVNTQGGVEEVIVNEIRLYNGDSYKVVNDIGYGILEAVMEAAVRWQFRPAEHNSERVKTYVKNSFNIGL